MRSTVPGEPQSGTTAGVFVPAEVLLRGGQAVVAPDGVSSEYGVSEYESNGYESDEYLSDEDGADYGSPVEALSGLIEPDRNGFDGHAPPPEHRNGHADVPVSLLPQRNPGASGIADIPSADADSVYDQAPEQEPPVEQDARWHDQQWPADSMPAQTPAGSDPWEQPESRRPAQAPANTSSFFASRANVAHEPVEPEAPAPSANGVHVPADREGRAAETASTPADSTDDAIFQSMLSEWLIDDPTELAKSADLDWQTVWDQGWSAAAAAEEAPVVQHTENGLPMRQPGVRLVPGAADNGLNGGAHRGADGAAREANGHGEDRPVPARDPEAVRSSIGNHFGGVRAGRSHARETRETDDE